MSAKHTPGPWSVDEPWQVWAESAGEYVAITQVEEFETLPRDQIEANARLIAAAPDLLDACRMVLMLERVGGMLPGVREIVQEAVNEARAAIAKAEGA